MRTNPLFNRKLQLAFGSAILALLLVGAMSYRGMLVSAESDRWVRHTHEVLENLQLSLSAMQDIESTDRGFVMTGNDQFLKVYRDNILTLQKEEIIIGNLTLDNPEQQLRILTLHGLTDQKIQYAETLISLRRTKGLEAAVDISRAGVGQAIMDQYRDVIRKMQDEELQLLVLRDADAKRRLGQTKAILVFGFVLGFLIAVAAGWSAQRDKSGRRLAEEALRNMTDRKAAEDALFAEKGTRLSNAQLHWRRCTQHRHPGKRHLPECCRGKDNRLDVPRGAWQSSRRGLSHHRRRHSGTCSESHGSSHADKQDCGTYRELHLDPARRE